MIVGKLQVNDLLGIHELTMENLDNIVKISGPNGAGKSRALTLLLACLKYDSLDLETRKEILECEGGKVTVNLTDDEVKFNNWTITREVKNGSAALTVKNDETGLTGNKATIEKMLGDNFVNLSRFLELPKEKIDAAVLKMLGIDDKLEELTAKIKDTELIRTATGQRINDIGLPSNPVEEVERVSVRELSEKLQDGYRANASISEASENIANCEERIKEYKIELKRIEEAIKDYEQSAENSSDYIKNTPKVDTEEIQKQIDAAEETNQKASAYSAYVDNAAKVFVLQEDYDKHSANLKTWKTEKKATIANAPFPIEGLGYDEKKGITFNNHGLISDGEYRRIVFEISRALKGELSIAIFENFSLLDPDAKAKVIKDADAAGFQLFLEIVCGKDDKVEDGFLIVDGKIK
jgi:hypothetical protein